VTRNLSILEKENKQDKNNLNLSNAVKSGKTDKKLLLNIIRDKHIDDNGYISKYLNYIQKLDVNFSTKYNDHIAEFAERFESLYDSRKFMQVPEKEKIIKVLIRLAISNAKLNMRKEVILDDILDAEKIITYSHMIN